MIRSLLIFLAFSGAAYAKCDMSSIDFEQMRKAHDSFLSDKNQETAKDFFASIPDTFCQFDNAYGFDDVFGARPLYGLKLYETLPRLPKYIEPGELSYKYVRLASEAEWDADSVNSLQHAYREVLVSHPGITIEKLANLDKEKQENAIRFLFDGPHPSNNGFTGDETSKFCEADGDLCERIQSIYSEMSDDDHGH